MRPYGALAAQLRSAVPPSSFLVADTILLAGNLRLALAPMTVVTPNQVDLFNCREPHCLMVWDARRRDLPPQPLLDWALSSPPLRFPLPLAHSWPAASTGPANLPAAPLPVARRTPIGVTAELRWSWQSRQEHTAAPAPGEAPRVRSRGWLFGLQRERECVSYPRRG